GKSASTRRPSRDLTRRRQPNQGRSRRSRETLSISCRLSCPDPNPQVKTKYGERVNSLHHPFDQFEKKSAAPRPTSASVAIELRWQPWSAAIPQRLLAVRPPPGGTQGTHWFRRTRTSSTAPPRSRAAAPRAAPDRSAS